MAKERWNTEHISLASGEAVRVLFDGDSFLIGGVGTEPMDPGEAEMVARALAPHLMDEDDVIELLVRGGLDRDAVSAAFFKGEGRLSWGERQAAASERVNATRRRLGA